MTRIALLLALAPLIATSQSFAADAPIDFQTQIQPIFKQHCVKCHGEKKALKKLRLDSAEQIQAFHEDHLVVAGKPDASELFERLVLPAEDKKRMPKGADPLPKEQIDLVREWIAQGASYTSAQKPSEKPASEEKSAAADTETAKPQAEPVPHDSEELKDVKAAADEAVKKIAATGASVMPLFGKSALLQVSFAQDSGAVNAANLATLAGAGEQIVWLNLSGSQVSPESLAVLEKLPNISQLHLEKSNLDDGSLKHVGSLDRLHYLNLYGTQVSDAGLIHLSGLKRLRKLYLWNTKVSYDAAMALEKAIPGLEVNLGWNHPVVARKRIEKQLANAKTEAEEAKQKAEAADQAAARAKEANERAAKRLQELTEELKEIEAPSDAVNEEAKK
ncbi:c-type cytochrome domain-containing protein [Adhaeretor mobilis]|uniref:Planctomycete cytochrome C n=1 Tax=Adhaeretor mobilis TaxID=1930276 RepID=A0A517N1Y8_9BACT|nr:c-type cytochrome domain-containing protein [Adhaeretor mobilis]QDT01143.1 Planctomycete cytochrome C [Adhaeretor mobilis]